MAKAATKTAPEKDDSKYEDWRVDDAMHTMLRAREIVGDKKMMTKVKKRAKQHAAKMADVARQADSLARRGLVSDKQLAKLKKTSPLASGKEGDSGKSQTMRGVVTS